MEEWQIMNRSGISHIVRSRPAEVSASNYFRVFQNVAHVPEKVEKSKMQKCVVTPPSTSGCLWNTRGALFTGKIFRSRRVGSVGREKTFKQSGSSNSLEMEARQGRESGTYLSKHDHKIRDGTGKPVRESNARIVRWSDGTYQLYIGSENVIDLQLKDNTENHQYVASINVLILVRLCFRKPKTRKQKTKVPPSIRFDA